ncbi:MAG TPA: DUF1801 domain-containing protein, partial [Thermoanaerobaculia bacterium]
MARSTATTVDAYLAGLPDADRETLAAVRNAIKDNLPAGYEERINFGMISYEIPLSRYPKTYNKQPLTYAALAKQKNYFAVYLMGVYASEAEAQRFRDEYQKSGKKLDMGKSCVRFKKLDDLPLELIGKTIASVAPDEFIARY